LAFLLSKFSATVLKYLLNASTTSLVLVTVFSPRAIQLYYLGPAFSQFLY
jgi:hypothetical protein